MRRTWTIALLSCLACGCVASQRELDQTNAASQPTGENVEVPGSESLPSKEEPPMATKPVVPTDDKGAFTTTASGLMYRIFEPGNDKKPNPRSTVTAKYRGWLDSGKEFDSGTITYPLSQLVDGWKEGLPMVGEGGKMELIVPPHLGYKEEGSPPVIPGNAWLHFEMELQKVE